MLYHPSGVGYFLTLAITRPQPMLIWRDTWQTLTTKATPTNPSLRRRRRWRLQSPLKLGQGSESQAQSGCVERSRKRGGLYGRPEVGRGGWINTGAPTSEQIGIKTALAYLTSCALVVLFTSTKMLDLVGRYSMLIRIRECCDFRETPKSKLSIKFLDGKRG